MQIEDGTGHSRLAEVTTENALKVRSTGTTEEHLRAEEGKAFLANTGDTASTLTATITGGFMLLLQYTGETSLVVEKISFSASAAGGVVSIIKNPVLGTLTNKNDHIPVNTNFSSGNEPNVLAQNWDEIGDGIGGVSGGTLVKAFIIPASAMIAAVDGSVILRKSDVIGIKYTGVVGEFECGIRFYEGT